MRNVVGLNGERPRPFTAPAICGRVQPTSTIIDHLSGCNPYHNAQELESWGRARGVRESVLVFIFPSGEFVPCCPELCTTKL